MLLSPTLPESWRALLDAFRPAFRRSRTFALFALLATGLITQTTRRTVVGMLAGAGMAAAVSFHAVCRFFSHHAWDTDRIGLTLARLIVSRLLAADAAIEVVVDDTLFRRWGPKVFGAFWTHDGSAQDPNALGRGNRWIIIGIVVTVPFCSHPVCLPVLFRLWRGKGTASPVQLARELISILAQAFPDRLVHAVGDAAYHGKALLVPATTITTRRPANAALYALAPPRTGKRCSRWSRNAATSGASRYSICSSEGDTSVRSAVPSAIAGVLIAARGPDAEALSGLASSAAVTCSAHRCDVWRGAVRARRGRSRPRDRAIRSARGWRHAECCPTR